MRRIALVCLGLMICSSFYAQELTLSPYSRYGIGDLFNVSTSRNAAMGGIGIATDNYFSINRINPASFADATFTTFDISGFAHFSQLRSSQQNENQKSAGFQNISFMFPSNKNLTLAFGFSPYSVVGYNISTQRAIDVSGVTQTELLRYEADGGLNQVFIGAAFKMLKKRLRLGASMLYSFGGARYLREASILEGAAASGSLAVTLEDQTFITGMGGQIGAMYVDSLKSSSLFLRIGAVVEFNGSLSGTRLLTSNNELFTDTLINEEGGEVDIPLKYGVGFQLSNPGKWAFGADVTFQNWEQFNYFSETSTLSSEMRIGLGGELTPDFASSNYLKRISYRFGAYHKQSYISFGGQRINDLGLTFGIGLPAGQSGTNQFNRARLYSKINLGVAIGRRGNVNQNLPLEELYARIRIGITLTDTWFIRRVVD